MKIDKCCYNCIAYHKTFGRPHNKTEMENAIIYCKACKKKENKALAHIKINPKDRYWRN